MDVTATEAKNRLGQMLDHCQREPVVIEKSGRRHSVLISAARFDELLAAESRLAPPEGEPRTAEEFYAKYKDWVDANNERVDRIGIWNEEFRRW
jgi:prevent-host-death family protein